MIDCSGPILGNTQGFYFVKYEWFNFPNMIDCSFFILDNAKGFDFVKYECFVQSPF